MRVDWLPDVLRAAGLKVNTYPGWETRGSASWGPLRGIICHATAGSRTSTDAGEMRVLWETGSTTAPTPIAQLYLSRSGVFTVGASGLCFHALNGQRGPFVGVGNSALLGIEAANDNRGEPWPDAQLDAYQRGVAAICKHMGWGADRAVAHWEHQTDKTDPAGIDMGAFRARVAQLIEEERMVPDTPVLNVVLDGTTARYAWNTPDGHGKAVDEVIFRLGDVPFPLPPKAADGNIDTVHGPWGTAYNHEGVELGKTYYAQVLARNTDGWSQPGSLMLVTAKPGGGGTGPSLDDIRQAFREELAKQPKPLTFEETVAAANKAEDQ